MKELTEAQAWRKLAEWYATGIGWICWNTGGWAGDPYFMEIMSAPSKPPFKAPWAKMHSRVSTHTEMGNLPSESHGYTVMRGLDRWSSQNSNPRVVFCLLMAIECEEELSTE